MRKIISLFKRDYDGTRLVFNELVPGAEWVIAGEGTATRKLDGTACMVRGGKLYRRHELKRGKQAPPDFEAAQEADTVTGDIPGWLPVGDGNESRWHRAAFNGSLPDGTYELCGPHIQGNPEHYSTDTLVPHGREVIPDAPRDFDGLREYFKAHDIEGIVWWRDVNDSDCDKVKIKAKDWGIKRNR